MPLKRRWARILSRPAVCIASAALLLGAMPAAADDSIKLQKMKYSVYTGGVNVVDADLTMDYTKVGRYRMFFEAKTQGILGTFVPWSGSFLADGWAMKDGRRIVELHESVATWRSDHEVKSYHYTKDGGFQNIVTKITHKKDKDEKPDSVLTKGTTDVLTATLKILEAVARGGKCEGRDEIFDGRRRYALIYKHSRFVMLEKSRHNAYEGPAAECTVEIEPIAGAWHSKPRGWLSIQEQGRARGMMPTVWIAQVKPNAVAVPVRVRVKTAYGTLFMHMSRYESGETILATQ